MRDKVKKKQSCTRSSVTRMAQSSHPDTQEFFSTLAKKIRSLRDERGWSVHQMVVEHGYYEQQYRKMEKGTCGLTVDSLLRLCSTFGISLEDLIKECGDFPRVKTPAKVLKRPGRKSVLTEA